MRVYDGKYLSVTSILALKQPFDKASFTKWCQSQGLNEALVSNLSRVLGEKVSEHLNNIQQGLQVITAPPVDDLEVRLQSAVQDFADKYKLVSTEEVIKCDKLHYAGRYDGIVESENGLMLCDWKTFGAWRNVPYKRNSAKIKKTRQQLSMYAYAMGWKDRLGVVIFKNDGTWELEEVNFDQDIINWGAEEETQKLILEVIEDEKTKKVKK